MFFGRSKEATKQDKAMPSARPASQPVPAKATVPVRPQQRDSSAPLVLIGQLLVEANLVNRDQLDCALVQQKATGKKLVETMIEMGFFTQQTFNNLMARQPGIASLDLNNYKVPKDLVDLIPAEFAAQHQVFPIDKLGRLFTVGMDCPLDKSTIAHLESVTGLRVKPILCSSEDISSSIKQYYKEPAKA